MTSIWEPYLCNIEIYLSMMIPPPLESLILVKWDSRLQESTASTWEPRPSKMGLCLFRTTLHLHGLIYLKIHHLGTPIMFESNTCVIWIFILGLGKTIYNYNVGLVWTPIFGPLPPLTSHELRWSCYLVIIMKLLQLIHFAQHSDRHFTQHNDNLSLT